MGLYTYRIPPFEDLRKHNVVQRKSAPPPKYGVEPKYANDVDVVVKHLLAARTNVSNKRQNRVGPKWRREVQNLLRGTTSSGFSFTPAQLCDIIDYAQSDDFWRPYVQEPQGLVRHAYKLWLRPDFTEWSKKAGKPEENRPSRIPAGALSGDKRLRYGAGERFRGEIPADQKHDSSSWEGEL